MVDDERATLPVGVWLLFDGMAVAIVSSRLESRWQTFHEVRWESGPKTKARVQASRSRLKPGRVRDRYVGHASKSRRDDGTVIEVFESSTSWERLLGIYTAAVGPEECPRRCRRLLYRHPHQHATVRHLCRLRILFLSLRSGPRLWRRHQPRFALSQAP